MPRSKTKTILNGAPPILAALFFASTLAAAPAAKPFHLQLEARPAAAFPYLAKFGTVTLDVYNGGVRADTIWLNGFSRNNSSTITVENPFGRMYTEVPLAQISTILQRLGAAAGVESEASPTLAPPVNGTVSGIAATRHRLVFGPTAYIDYWTTDVIPENPQVRAIAQRFVAAISPGTARAAESVRGMPLYVELNFRRFRKVALLRTISLTSDNSGEKDALETGALYFKAPLLDSLWK